MLMACALLLPSGGGFPAKPWCRGGGRTHRCRLGGVTHLSDPTAGRGAFKHKGLLGADGWGLEGRGGKWVRVHWGLEW